MSAEDFEKEFDFRRPTVDGSVPGKALAIFAADDYHGRMAKDRLVAYGFVNTAIGIFQGGDDSIVAWTRSKGPLLTADGIQSVGFQEVKTALWASKGGGLGAKTKVLDVRRASERERPGHIPDTVNVPLNEISDAFLRLSDKDFEKRYGFQKPAKGVSDRIITCCLSGKRALDAADRLVLLGYQVSVYRGSLKDWRARGGPVLSIVDFDEIRTGLDEKSITLVDVREAAERRQEGAIPESYNLPLSDFTSALGLTPLDFKLTFGFVQPAIGSRIAVYADGPGDARGSHAAGILASAGITCALYQGGMAEWRASEGSLKGE